ncbi:MAG: DUF4276 family protein [Candidatus Dadabacteria bacterium]|nr:DUF4276 family protein [Candidatus Dadabacteria bacterium]
MKKVIIVCEGQTEEAFVNKLLYPELWAKGVFTEPRIISTSPLGKGGVLSGERVLRYLRNTLRERGNTYVTTFFDLFALPQDFPGLKNTPMAAGPLDHATEIETALHNAVVREAGCLPERFFPHIQPYEFEALLFSDTTGFVRAEPAWKAFAGKLASIRENAKSPEYINDGADTHPSARLQNLLHPRYKKVTHGAGVSAEIGIDRIRSECQHFDQWLSRIEAVIPLEQQEI